MRRLLLVATCATLPAVVSAADPAMQQRSLADQNAETLLLKDSAPITRRTSPEAERAAALAMQEREARHLYAQLFESLQLNYEQVDEATRLLAERALLTTSWSTGNLKHAAAPEDHHLVRENLSRIEGVLGRAGFAQFSEYEKTLAERYYLRRLFNGLIIVGRPLTDEQMTQLVTIAAAERRRLAPGRTNAPPGTLENAEELVTSLDDFDRRVEYLFGSVLSSDQREFAAEHFAARAQRRHAALDRYRRSLAEGDNSYGFLFSPD